MTSADDGMKTKKEKTQQPAPVPSLLSGQAVEILPEQAALAEVYPFVAQAMEGASFDEIEGAWEKQSLAISQAQGAFQRKLAESIVSKQIHLQRDSQLALESLVIEHSRGEELIESFRRQVLTYEYDNRESQTIPLEKAIDETDLAILEHLTLARQLMQRRFELATQQSALWSRLAQASERYGLPRVGERPVLTTWRSKIQSGEMRNWSVLALTAYLERLLVGWPAEQVPDLHEFKHTRL